MFKCINCSWEGETPKESKFCPICGDWVKEVEKPKPVIKEEIKPAKKTTRKKKKK